MGVVWRENEADRPWRGAIEELRGEASLVDQTQGQTFILTDFFRMLRRRQALQPGSTCGENASLWDGGYDETNNRTFTSSKRRRNARLFVRAHMTRAAALVLVISILLISTSFLPLPLRTGRVVRNATVRLVASSTRPRRSLSSFNLIFPSHISTTASIMPADQFLSQQDFLHGIGRPNYDGLVVPPMAPHDISRAIHAADTLRYEEEREQLLEAIDDESQSVRVLHYEDYAPDYRQCQRNNWRDRQFPNCLTFHETSVLDRPLPGPMKHGFDIQYTGHGYFRDSWMYQSADEQFVLKKMRHNKAFDYEEGLSKYLCLVFWGTTEMHSFLNLVCSTSVPNSSGGHCHGALNVQSQHCQHLRPLCYLNHVGTHASRSDK